jgi:muramoyltetrapeptide carboxypeptidase
MKDKKRPYGKSAAEIVSGAVESFNFPVAFGFPAGHTQNNNPFLLGADIELLVRKKDSTIKYI